MLFLTLSTCSQVMKKKLGDSNVGALGGAEAPPLGECVPRPMAPSVHRWEAGVKPPTRNSEAPCALSGLPGYAQLVLCTMCRRPSWSSRRSMTGLPPMGQLSTGNQWSMTRLPRGVGGWEIHGGHLEPKWPPWTSYHPPQES